MAKNRKYTCKDVDMLMASKTIAESFRANIPDLSAIRSNWTEQYSLDLVACIDAAIADTLGTDAKKDLRGATAALFSIQAPAKRDLAFVKLTITEEFAKIPARRDEILNTLGFTFFSSKGAKANQEELVQLLVTFKTNLTDTLRQEIIAAGMNDTLIKRILGYAETYRQANVLQESLKSSTKDITGDMVETFNQIYHEIIVICKTGSKYYRSEPLKRERFNFAKMLANMGTGRKARVDEPETANAS
jgi:hypothetical protein